MAMAAPVGKTLSKPSMRSVPLRWRSSRAMRPPVQVGSASAMPAASQRPPPWAMTRVSAMTVCGPTYQTLRSASPSMLALNVAVALVEATVGRLMSHAPISWAMALAASTTRPPPAPITTSAPSSWPLATSASTAGRFLSTCLPCSTWYGMPCSSSAPVTVSCMAATALPPPTMSALLPSAAA